MFNRGGGRDTNWVKDGGGTPISMGAIIDKSSSIRPKMRRGKIVENYFFKA
jgi:hypothetical protein